MHPHPGVVGGGGGGGGVELSGPSLAVRMQSDGVAVMSQAEQAAEAAAKRGRVEDAASAAKRGRVEDEASAAKLARDEAMVIADAKVAQAKLQNKRAQAEVLDAETNRLMEYARQLQGKGGSAPAAAASAPLTLQNVANPSAPLALQDAPRASAPEPSSEERDAEEKARSTKADVPSSFSWKLAKLLLVHFYNVPPSDLSSLCVEAQDFRTLLDAKRKSES